MLLSLMFVNQFLCIEANSFLCNVKADSQRDSFLVCWIQAAWYADNIQGFELTPVITQLLRFHPILYCLALFLLNVMKWILLAFGGIAVKIFFLNVPELTMCDCWQWTERTTSARIEDVAPDCLFISYYIGCRDFKKGWCHNSMLCHEYPSEVDQSNWPRFYVDHHQSK